MRIPPILLSVLKFNTKMPGLFLFQVLQPSAKEKYPAFTFMQGHGRDYDLYAGLTPEKREWPFIRNTQKTVITAGDFVLL